MAEHEVFKSSGTRRWGPSRDWIRVDIETVVWQPREDGRFGGLCLKPTRQAGLSFWVSKPRSRLVRAGCRDEGHMMISRSLHRNEIKL